MECRSLLSRRQFQEGHFRADPAASARCTRNRHMVEKPAFEEMSTRPRRLENAGRIEGVSRGTEGLVRILQTDGNRSTAAALTAQANPVGPAAKQSV